MADEGSRQSSAGYQWDLFVRETKGFPIPNTDPLYALPLPLVDALAATGFLTKEEKAFEEALTSTSGGAFVGRQAYSENRQRVLNMQFLLGDDFEDCLASQSQQARLDKVRGSREQNQAEFEQHAAIVFGSSEKVAAMGRLRDEFEATDRKTRIAYSAWLVTNPQFQGELAHLRAVAPPSVGRQGKFPMLSRDSELQLRFLSRYTKRLWLPQDESERGFQKQCDEFFIRWCCESLFAWNIPVPMRIQLGVPMPYERGAWLAGVAAFIPWYALKDREMDLRRHMDLERSQLCGEHLDPWIRKGNKNLGKRQFAKIFRLYVYFELAICARYPKKVEGRLNDIEKAFHRFFHGIFKSGKAKGLDVDSVKKLRQFLGRSRGASVPGETPAS